MPLTLTLLGRAGAVDLGRMLTMSRRQLVTGGHMETIDSPVTGKRARENPKP